jgi:hypothetical protein
MGDLRSVETILDLEHCPSYLFEKNSLSLVLGHCGRCIDAYVFPKM